VRGIGHCKLYCKSLIKLRSRGEQTYARPFFCRDFDLGHMTLKLDRDAGILKMYRDTENEVAMSSYSDVKA